MLWVPGTTQPVKIDFSFPTYFIVNIEIMSPNVLALEIYVGS